MGADPIRSAQASAYGDVARREERGAIDPANQREFADVLQQTSKQQTHASSSVPASLDGDDKERAPSIEAPATHSLRENEMMRGGQTNHFNIVGANVSEHLDGSRRSIGESRETQTAALNFAVISKPPKSFRRLRSDASADAADVTKHFAPPDGDSAQMAREQSSLSRSAQTPSKVMIGRVEGLLQDSGLNAILVSIVAAESGFRVVAKLGEKVSADEFETLKHNMRRLLAEYGIKESELILKQHESTAKNLGGGEYGR